MSLLEARDLVVTYEARGRRVEAVRGVSLAVERGERVGLIGESGSGKSSLLRALLGLEPLSGGATSFDGQPLHGAPRALRKRVQPVFQDVGASLDPRLRVREVLAEPFEIHGLPVEEPALVELLGQVQLPPEVLGRLPRELSVGQRQRVNLARALALGPEALLLDEPVSALDVSVQAQVINLLNELVTRRALTVLVISHDLDVVAHLCTRVLVLFAGRVVEEGPAAALLEAPRHPYTQLLVAQRTAATAAVGPAAEAPPAAVGCAFAPRCPHAQARCRAEVPTLTGAAHRAACFVFGAP